MALALAGGASQYFKLGFHGHTVFGVAVQWKLAFSKPHGHVEDSMTVAPDSRQMEQLNGLGARGNAG